MNKVLCIDDEPKFLINLEKDVISAGGVFVRADTVEGAIQALDEQPMLIICDGMNSRWVEIAKAAMKQGISNFVLYTTTPPKSRLVESLGLRDIVIWDKMYKREDERRNFISEVLNGNYKIEQRQ
jgi:hypothetical protein